MFVIKWACNVFLIIFGAIFLKTYALKEFEAFQLGRVEPQKLKINSKTTSLNEDGSLGVYSFNNLKNETVITSILFPDYAVLFDQGRRQFCSGKYSADSHIYTAGNEITFFLNYWTDQYTDRYWVLESDQGVICMLPYSLETNFTKVFTHVDSDFQFELAPTYEPNNTNSIIKQSPLFQYSQSCTLGLFQGCFSSEFVLSLPDSSFTSGLEFIVRGMSLFRTSKGIFSELVFYDKTASNGKILHILINPNMIGIHLEKAGTQVWGELNNQIEIGNMKFIYDFRVIFKEKWVYVVSQEGQTLVSSELPQDFSTVGKIVSSPRSVSDPILIQVLQASTLVISKDFIQKEAFCILSTAPLTTQIQDILGFYPEILYTESYHLDVTLIFQSPESIQDEDLLLAISFDEILIDPYNLQIQKTEYLIYPKLRIGIFKGYISLEDMQTRTIITGSYPAQTQSKINIQLQPLKSDNKLRILYQIDQLAWFMLAEVSVDPERPFNKIKFEKNPKHLEILTHAFTTGAKASSIVSNYTDSTSFISPKVGNLCKLLPLSYCKSQDVSFIIKEQTKADQTIQTESLMSINNITIQIPNFPSSNDDLMYKWKLLSNDTPVYEISIFQASISIVNLITYETVAGPPMSIISQYSENIGVSIIFQANDIFIVDSETNNIIASIPESKNLNINKIQASSDNRISVNYYSSYAFTPGPKTTSTQSSILNVLFECHFFNQCDIGNYVCKGSSARQLCKDPGIMKLWYNGPLISTDTSLNLGVFPNSLSVFTIGSQNNNLFIINVFESYISLNDLFSGKSCYNQLPNKTVLTQSSNVKFGIILSNGKKVDLVFFSDNNTPYLLCSLNIDGRIISDFYFFESNGQGLSSTIGDITMNTEQDDLSSSLTIVPLPTNHTYSILTPYISSDQLDLELSYELKANMGVHFEIELDPNSVSPLVVGISILNKYQDIHTQLYISGGSNPSVLLGSNIPGVGILTNHSSIPDECTSIKDSLISGGNIQFTIGVDVEIFIKENLGIKEEIKIPYLYVILCNQSLAKVPMGGFNIYKLLISNRSVLSTSTTLINGFYANRSSSKIRDLSVVPISTEDSLSDYKENCEISQNTKVTSYCLSSSLTIEDSSGLMENYELTVYLAIQDFPEFKYGNSTYYNGISYQVGGMSSFVVLFNETHLGVLNLIEKREIWNLYGNDALMSVSSWISISVNRISGFIHFTLNDQIFASFPDYPSQHVSIQGISLLQPGSWSVFQGVKQDSIYESNRYPFMYHGFIECSFEDDCQVTNEQTCVGNSFSGLCPYPSPDGIAWLFNSFAEVATDVNNGTFGRSFEIPDLVHAYKLNDGFFDIFAFYFFKDYAAIQYLLDGTVCRNSYGLGNTSSSLDIIPSNFQWGFYLGNATINLLTDLGGSGIKEICSLNIPKNTDLRLNVVYPVGHFLGIIEATKKNKANLTISEVPPEQETDANPCMLEMFKRCKINDQVQLSPNDTYFKYNYVFEFSFVYDESKEYNINFKGITPNSSLNPTSSKKEDLINLSILGKSLQLSNSQSDVSMADILLENAVSGTTVFSLFAYLSPKEDHFILVSSLDLETENTNSRLRNLAQGYKGVLVSLNGKISEITTDQISISNPTVYLNNWLIEADSLKPSSKHLTCMLDEINPNTWCVGLNATYNQFGSESKLIWFNFTFSNDIQGDSSTFEYYDSYIIKKENNTELIEINFGRKEFQVKDLVSNTLAVSFYPNKTVVAPGMNYRMGIGVLEETPDQIYFCDVFSHLLLNIPFNSSEISGTNYIVNNRKEIFSYFMLDSKPLSINETLVQGYKSCSFESKCGLETLTCTSQVLEYPCPRSTPGLYWLISSKILDTNLSSGDWGKEFVFDNLLGSYIILGDPNIKFIIHFFRNKIVFLDPNYNLSCSGPYISNKPAPQGGNANWSIGFDSNDMVFLGFFDQINQKHYTICGFKNFGKDIPFVSILPVGSTPAVSVFRQFGSGFPTGGFESTSSLQNNYGFYHPEFNTTSQEYIPSAPYGMNLPFLPVGVPAIDSQGLETPPGFFFNKTTSQYEPLGSSEDPNSLRPPIPFQLTEGIDECELEIYSFCNSTNVSLLSSMNNLEERDWSLFVMVSTGIPTYPQDSKPDFNFQFKFKDEQDQIKFTINISNSSIVIFGSDSSQIAIAVSPQCGPYCSTYPKGYFTFWLQKKSTENKFSLSVDYNRLLLVEFESDNRNFTKVESIGDSVHNPVPTKTYVLWNLLDMSDSPKEIATTTTTTTKIPWDKDIKDECHLELNQPCRGNDAILDKPLNNGDIIWINTLLGKSSNPIQLDGNDYWFNYNFKKNDSNSVISLLFNETSVAIYLYNSQETLSSRYTNQHLLYEGMDITIGLAFNRFGLFLLNKDFNALIHDPSIKTLDYNQITQENVPDHISNFLLKDKFTYPKNILFRGYETCSLYEDCKTSSKSCESQAMVEMCNPIQPGTEISVQTNISETNVNNGTWGTPLIQSDLFNIFHLGNGDKDMYTIYLYKDRIVLEDMVNYISCGGPYPNGKTLDLGSTLEWSIGLDSKKYLFLNVLNVLNDTNSNMLTVCSMSLIEGIHSLDFISPSGFNPSNSIFIQKIGSFKQGGYESTSKGDIGYYFPIYDVSKDEYLPDIVYGDSFSYYPPGIHPAPITDDNLNNPPGYHYNTTTGQFEKDENNLNSDLENPSRPTHIVNGIPQCELSLFTTCNASSIKIIPEDIVFKEFWTLFVISSTGIPPKVSESNPFNYKYEFINTENGKEELVLSLIISNETVTFRNEKNNTENIVGSPQCGPYCSTYPKGFFAFWLTYDSITNKYIVSIENNSKKLVEIDSGGVEFHQVRPCQACQGVPESEMYSIWKLFGSKTQPTEVSTTTTTTTKAPWQDQIVENCIVSQGSDPCRGTNVEVLPEIQEGDILWINTTLEISDPKIRVNNKLYWQGIQFKKNNQNVFSLLFDEMFLLVHIENAENEYYSPYTNYTLSYSGREILIGVARSKYGYFILNQNLGSLITLNSNGIDLSFNQAFPLSSHDIVSNFELENGFLLPINYLFIGYETCSLNEDCILETTSCVSQVLKGLCPNPNSNRVWIIETEISETNINNGTWSESLVLDGLMNTYFLSTSSEILYNVLLFDNRIVIEDVDNNITCSGAYPDAVQITYGKKFIWSFGFNENSKMIYFNSATQDNPSQFRTICSMPYTGKRSQISTVYPLGYAPSKAIFTQKKNGLPEGGFQTTSIPNNGFYFPDQNNDTGVFQPENKYGQYYPEFPLGLKPAPTNGDNTNTPENYHYNSTTGQFEKNPDHPDPNELNPFQPTHIVDGISECDLYLFSTCNGTSAKIIPPDTIFKKKWTLFVILATGIPKYPDQSNNVAFNYKYNFVKYQDNTSTGGVNTQEVVLSLSFNNDTITFKNEKTNIENMVGSPQCGPYCSTYPNGFFTFWLTYDIDTNKYVISIDSNSKKLIEIEAEMTQDLAFNKIVPEIDTNTGGDISKTYSVWQLTKMKKIPDSTAVTTTTTTTTTTSTTSTTTEIPWYDSELDECPIIINKPCRGINGVLDTPFVHGNLLWINGTLGNEIEGRLLLDSKNLMGYDIMNDNQNVMTLLLNETFIGVYDLTKDQEYYSYYTNESLAYNGMEFKIGIGWSKLGLFILNEYSSSLIEIQTHSDYTFNKVRARGPIMYKYVDYVLLDNFLYPNGLLYLGYETCSFNGECKVKSLECSSQVLTGLCLKKSPGISWKMETILAQTNVNNGTWGDFYSLNSLINIYTLNNGIEDILVVYFFDNRVAIQDLVNSNACSGPYPNNSQVNVGDLIIWSIGIDYDMNLYLNIIDNNEKKNYTVCYIKNSNQFGGFKYLSPLGYKPNYSRFIQELSPQFQDGGYESTSTPDNGYYFPEKDQNSGKYNPNDKYGESYPFFPPGVHPAPINGDNTNTPENYHYNSTTGQFEKNPDHPDPNELNPFQPNHIVDGISECNLYLFSTCNGTSAKIMPDGTVFKQGWTLFVMISTGVPMNDNINNYNYKYEFMSTNDDGSDIVVLSLEYSNQTVTFRNNLNNTENVVGSPQCGPYCSTYPKGYFAFWLTYESTYNYFIVSVNNNNNYLTSISADGISKMFNKIVPKGNDVGNTFNIWYLNSQSRTPYFY
ncbi:uncharacterized protein cubi_00884 [Cryptosporidium ubiquitum]|uniref:Uncharacterized protein n=1 Tax=Cryptosporidium ubiquitum TaxID=857276 RepID=A0A1J4MLN5_9CRYT|nr:uncharacterized protein cubi_00884 [Cryptosporidium ubiquitum]OII74959.1 hypothetical protein cubi_00884 [Cryptosporidium ubiquitum]